MTVQHEREESISKLLSLLNMTPVSPSPTQLLHEGIETGPRLGKSFQDPGLM